MSSNFMTQGMAAYLDYPQSAPLGPQGYDLTPHKVIWWRPEGHEFARIEWFWGETLIFPSLLVE